MGVEKYSSGYTMLNNLSINIVFLLSVFNTKQHYSSTISRILLFRDILQQLLSLVMRFNKLFFSENRIRSWLITLPGLRWQLIYLVFRYFAFIVFIISLNVGNPKSFQVVSITITNSSGPVVFQFCQFCPYLDLNITCFPTILYSFPSSVIMSEFFNTFSFFSMTKVSSLDFKYLGENHVFSFDFSIIVFCVYLPCLCTSVFHSLCFFYLDIFLRLLGLVYDLFPPLTLYNMHHYPPSLLH